MNVFFKKYFVISLSIAHLIILSSLLASQSQGMIVERTTKDFQPPSSPSSQASNKNQHHCSKTSTTTFSQIRRAAGSKKSVTALPEAVEKFGWTTQELNTVGQDDEEGGKTALHMAAWKGCIENVQYLIETMHCDVNVYSKGIFSYGKTPIFFAATQSRVDVMEYLLHQPHVKVTIVNNKGQSLLSLASSHDMPSWVIDRIRQLEQNDADGWWNFRATHSDGLEYGDLDPRLLDRPLRPTDIVTELAVNPTTKELRKGGFAERNPEVAARERIKQQQAKEKKKEKLSPSSRKKNRSGLTLLEESEWNELFEQLTKQLSNVKRNRRDHDDDHKSIIQKSGHWSSSCSKILLRIVRLGSKYRRSWIPDTANMLVQLAQNDEGGRYDNDGDDVENLILLDQLIQEARKITEDRRENQLLDKIRVRVIDRNRNNSVELTSNYNKYKKASVSLDWELWNTASLMVEGLSFSQLENNDCDHSGNKQSKILSLSHPPVFINTVHHIQRLQQQLLSRYLTSRDSKDPSFLIAIDAEWYDVEGEEGQVEEALSTIQIAFKSLDNDTNEGIQTFVVDLTVRQHDYYQLAQGLVRWILDSKNVLVLGFALGNDIPLLQRFVEDSNCKLSSSPMSLQSSLLDLQLYLALKLNHGNNDSKLSMLPGLKTCASKFSSVPLSKSEQKSNWSERPLRQAQLDYAGLDAAILLVLLGEQKRSQDKQEREASYNILRG